jgi:hypothetical protein
MKTKFTLIIAGLLAVSVTNSFANSKIKTDNNSVKQHGDSGFKNREAREIGSKEGYPHRQATHPDSYMKSAMATKQKLDYMIFEEFDTETNQWEKDKEELYYDDKGRNIEIIGYYWDISTNQWAYEGKESIVYDENGNNTQWIYSSLDEETGNWIISDKDESIYNSNGNLTQSISYRVSFPKNSTFCK